MSKILGFIKKKKKNILKITILILVLVLVSLAFYFLFKSLGITEPEVLRKIILDAKGYGVVVFILLQVASTIFLSFVPFLSMSFILVGVGLWGPTFKTFAICFSGVIISSLIMDLLGRFGGSKVVTRLIGKKDYEEASDLVKDKGMVYVPFMYLLPLFPDDAICMVCGASKMNFWLHFLFIVLFRGVGAATIVFGLNVIPPEVRNFSSKNPFDYIVVLLTIVLGLLCIFSLARRLDKWLSKKLKRTK